MKKKKERKKTQPSSKLKNAASANSITNFFTKSEKKPSFSFPVNESTKPSTPVIVSHLSDSAMFSGCPPGVKDDIALGIKNNFLKAQLMRYFPAVITSQIILLFPPTIKHLLGSVRLIY